MGSGLILLVIVGAWLAVLVPMALRSHDTSASLTSVDRFSDAMRVLSRREPRTLVTPRRPAAAPVGLTLAERRRRVLVTLLSACVATLLFGLVGPGWMLGLHVVCDLLAVSFVVHLRRQAMLKAERQRQRRQALRRLPAEARPSPAQAGAVLAQESAAGVQVVGVPDRMPARPAPLAAPLPAPAARYEDGVPAAAGATWDPVPVPIPTYVTAPKAPRRRPRVLDLTRPGEWSEALASDDAVAADEAELEVLIERRRAVGGW